MIATSPPPVAASSAAVTNDIRDIKPPIAIPNGWEWVWWVLAALAVAAAAIFVWRWWQIRRLQILVEPPLPAHVRAKQKLDEALALISQPKPFCTLVSDTIRLYLEECFNFRAPERTTEEFLYELQDTDLLLPEQKETLSNFFESCDLVKFAKYEPGEPELRELHGSALRLVEETEPKPELPTAETPEPRLQTQDTSQ
ncbi:MAG: hypothetical protein ABSB84_06485 [Verrucomicrobiota bacterium]|jgi:hypothetical protein